MLCPVLFVLSPQYVFRLAIFAIIFVALDEFLVGCNRNQSILPHYLHQLLRVDVAIAAPSGYPQRAQCNRPLGSGRRVGHSGREQS
eukprot:1062273-Pyramimonas_sp.AAC.1